MAPSVKNNSTLKALKAQLKGIQSSLNDISRFVEQFKEDTSVTQITIRLDRIDSLWEKYSETLVSILGHAQFEEEEDEYERKREKDSDRFYEMKSFLLDKARERQPALEHNQSIRDVSMLGGLDHVRLPQIKLQSFNGEMELPEVEKFHYLKGCLQGEPKNLIDPLPLTEANYQVAWNTLLKRYDNSKVLRKRQIQALFKLPALQRESVGELHNLLEGFERIVQTLDQVVQPRDYKDLLLVNFLTTRMDPVTRRSWEEQSANKDQDTVKDITEFLHRRLRILESMPPKAMERNTHQLQVSSKVKSTAVRTSYNLVQSSAGNCVICKDNHMLYQCSRFQRLSVMERDSVLKANGLCRNCFKVGHQARDCQSRYSCRKCQRRHHTLVCFRSDNDVRVGTHPKPSNFSNPKEPKGSSSNASSSQVAEVAASDVVASNVANQISSQVLLATAIILLEDEDGNRFVARALLDSGSESNFITQSLCQRMRVHRSTVDVSVMGIGESASKVKHRIETMVLSRNTEFSRKMEFLVLPKVTVNLPTTRVSTEGWSIPTGFTLADPSFFQPNAVDVVLGIESFFDFFHTGRTVSLGEHLPTLTETVFGWVIGGGVSSMQHSLRINCHVSSSCKLETLVERFWECEELDSTKTYSKEEQMCEKIFEETVKRTSEGRYVVALPQIDHMVQRLGESREIAYRRLQATERRLARNAMLCKQYYSFMEEYLRLGHMQKVSDQNPCDRSYLPHHPVVKEASTTTKVRVVFDASCRTSTGVALNDCLLSGPTIQEDLRSIILRCRMKYIMMVADVEKMFRQILVRQEDRHLQCILWRSSPAADVNVYELCTVTYGTKSAPFLATRTLHQLAQDEEHRFPLAAKAIHKDTYVDDVLSGVNSVQEALELRLQLEGLLSSGGFRLRKWASNCQEALDGIAEENLALHTKNSNGLDPDPWVKILGLSWIPKTDCFKFDFTFPIIEETAELSKRQILSVIAMLFDPLGLIGAVITTAKVLMQLLWTLTDEAGQRLNWDQPIPSTDHEEAVDKYCSNEGMQWRFIPPRSPHFGGLWEAAVRSSKHHLLKVLGENPESPEDLITLLTQIEACLNSRPLTAMSDDPNDMEPLTPAHFLIGSSLQAIPDLNYENVPANRLRNMQRMQQKVQLFWRRWRREYLHTLQARTKRWKPPIHVKIGQLVVIQDDNQSPSHWKMGRICELHPGSDGVVRVVTLRTATGLLKRAVEKLCLLPYMDHEEDSELEI
ncbi:uncharacterized protein LOC134222535 [Armigeres subalbatus]|uniref:uncharacterized protein LOC134222535 n=1 Tax=Armigeres subalbatus TaxID=124917 RepID=UPI002ED3FF51